MLVFIGSWLLDVRVFFLGWEYFFFSFFGGFREDKVCLRVEDGGYKGVEGGVNVRWFFILEYEKFL